jgi:hypothetical protein
VKRAWTRFSGVRGPLHAFKSLSHNNKWEGHSAWIDAPSPKSHKNSFFSCGEFGGPSRKFSGFTSPWTYLRNIRTVGSPTNVSRQVPTPTSSFQHVQS